MKKKGSQAKEQKDGLANHHWSTRDTIASLPLYSVAGGYCVLGAGRCHQGPDQLKKMRCWMPLLVAVSVFHLFSVSLLNLFTTYERHHKVLPLATAERDEKRSKRTHGKNARADGVFTEHDVFSDNTPVESAA